MRRRQTDQKLWYIILKDINAHVPIFADINIFTSQYTDFFMDIQGQPSQRSKTKVWERSLGWRGWGSGHFLNAPYGAEGQRPKKCCIKTLSFSL